MGGFLWLYMALPETKGSPLEQIQQLFSRPGDDLGDHDDTAAVDAHGLNGDHHTNGIGIKLSPAE